MARIAALYARVSTHDQTCDNQIQSLRDVAQRMGWEIIEEYVDQGISGAKGRDQRLAFDRLLKDATRGRFDIALAWSVDRLGRSLQDLVAFLSEIHASGVDLYLHQQGINTTTPAGKALFQMMGVFAEFERSIIQERILAGMARVKVHGTRSGRPVGRPRISPDVEQAIRDLRAKGKGVNKVARELGIGVSVVQRIDRERAVAA